MHDKLHQQIPHAGCHHHNNDVERCLNGEKNKAEMTEITNRSKNELTWL